MTSTSWTRRIAIMILSSMVYLPPALADDSRLPEIWFFLRGDPAQLRGADSRQGWQKLFLDHDTTWPPSLDQVSVVVLSGDIPDDILQKAITVLNRRHVKLALEILAQSWVGEPTCGNNVESYTDPPGNAKIARRIKAAGGILAYVTMDEPFYFGHYYDGANACHSPIDNVAERAAAIVHEYRAVLPKLLVGDTEPFPALPKQRGWRNDYRLWLNAFRQAAGLPVSFLVMDINWPEDAGRWDRAVTDAATLSQNLKLPYGMIYNASLVEGPKTDEAWLASAVQNYTHIEQDLHLNPAKALFESWSEFPRRSITDRSGPGEDHLVSDYVLFRGTSDK